jgi:hypothetical protein
MTWIICNDHRKIAVSEGESVILARFTARVTRANARISISPAPAMFTFLEVRARS